MRGGWLIVVVCVGVSTAARATPPDPGGTHPRILLDPALRMAWRDQAKKGRGPVVGAIALCNEARSGSGHDDAQYYGSEWAKTLQACLVAWAATDSPLHEATALRFFKALLDDEQHVGDDKGGDAMGTRDSGYAIRNLAPYTAIAYDWLWNAPGMTPELRRHARERWAKWLGWYAKNGYRRREPGNNYQAGYLISATLVAIAEGGEAADQDGPRLWRFVADELWGKDMAAVLATDGLLDGGDWPEGWQYGPLSVAEYALAARVVKRHGIAVEGVAPWLASMLRRHVYALTPGDGVWAGGDFEPEVAYQRPNALTLDAIALGDARPEDQRWAKGELSRLKITDSSWLLYDALASVGDAPELPPRTSWPTWYRTTATSALYARTRWDDKAIWFVGECSRTLDADHRHPDAGNFALSRGHDDVVIDPSPYGSLSTLTSNAPTVMSTHLPKEYIPSQGYWGKRTRWLWATKTRGSVVAARCDYADQYRFQDRSSDVPEALRDLVLLPNAAGTDAALVVIDRAETGDPERKMLLRFRIPGELALDGNGAATTTIGSSRLAIHGASNPTLAKPAYKDCFKDGIRRGQCDSARVPVTDYRVELAGPKPRAVHIIYATDAKRAGADVPLSGDGWSGVHVTSPRDAVVVWSQKPGSSTFAYRAPRGPAITHVVLDAPDRGGTASIAATPDGDACAITVSAGGTFSSRPAIFTVDAACAVSADPEATNAASALGTRPAQRSNANRGSGCCDAGSASSSPVAVVCALLLRRRRRTR